MDQTDVTIDRIKELEDQVAKLTNDQAYYMTVTDLLQTNLEERDLQIKHLVGELSKSKADSTYEPQISIAAR